MLRRMVSDQGTGSGGEGVARSRGSGGGGALFKVPRLFVGFAAKRAADGGESERSPTSPLDPKALLLRSPRSPRTWDSEPVGLGLVDALAGDATRGCLLSPRVRLKSHSSSPATTRGCGGHSQPELGKTIPCPASDAAAAATAGMSVPCSRFFHRDLKSGPEATLSVGAHSSPKRHSFDLPKLPAPASLPATAIAGGPRRYVASVSASEVEQSEDYTCIIARGPNPKTTHIFGDCILEPHAIGENDDTAMEVKEGPAKSYLVLVKCAAADADDDEDFLNSCFTCKKKLEGNDIYIYLGEKAFCSAECRCQEILIEEEAKNTTTTAAADSGSPRSSLHDGIFTAGMVVAT